MTVACHLTDTGRPKTCRLNASAPGSSCTPWPRRCATRSTSTVSGLSAGTPTRARTCPTTTMTRKGQNSPPSGKRPTSCPVSSSCSTSCTGRAWSGSAWRTAPRWNPLLSPPSLGCISSVETSMWPTMHGKLLGSSLHPHSTYLFTSHCSFSGRRPWFNWWFHLMASMASIAYWPSWFWAPKPHSSPLHGCWPWIKQQF